MDRSESLEPPPIVCPCTFPYCTHKVAACWIIPILLLLFIAVVILVALIYTCKSTSQALPVGLVIAFCSGIIILAILEFILWFILWPKKNKRGELGALKATANSSWDDNPDNLSPPRLQSQPQFNAGDETTDGAVPARPAAATNNTGSHVYNVGATSSRPGIIDYLTNRSMGGGLQSHPTRIASPLVPSVRQDMPGHHQVLKSCQIGGPALLSKHVFPPANAQRKQVMFYDPHSRQHQVRTWSGPATGHGNNLFGSELPPRRGSDSDCSSTAAQVGVLAEGKEPVKLTAEQLGYDEMPNVHAFKPPIRSESMECHISYGEDRIKESTVQFTLDCKQPGSVSVESMENNVSSKAVVESTIEENAVTEPDSDGVSVLLSDEETAVTASEHDSSIAPSASTGASEVSLNPKDAGEVKLE